MLFIFFLRSFGYGFAVLTAVVVTLFFPFMPALVGWHDPKGLIAVFVVGCAITGIGTLPGFILAVYWQSVNGCTASVYWIGSGVGAALFANVLFALVFAPFIDFSIFNSSLAGGAVGGFVYSVFQRRIAFYKQNLTAILKK